MCKTGMPNLFKKTQCTKPSQLIEGNIYNNILHKALHKLNLKPAIQGKYIKKFAFIRKGKQTHATTIRLLNLEKDTP